MKKKIEENANRKAWERLEETNINENNTTTRKLTRKITAVGDTVIM